MAARRRFGAVAVINDDGTNVASYPYTLHDLANPPVGSIGQKKVWDELTRGHGGTTEKSTMAQQLSG